MKAYLIDPYETIVTEVEYSGEYEDIYELIDCETFDCVGFKGFVDTIYIDDEGLYKEDRRFFMVDGYPNPLCGKALVLGTDKDGNSVEPKTSLTDLRGMISFPRWFYNAGGRQIRGLI
jgi:hypothetical protein